jgi:HD-like signal output (HDOD) protein
MSEEKIIDLKDIMKKMEDLPILPNVITKVMKIFDNPYSNASHLTELISMDQTLTMKTLKLANSAYYGFPREIETVTEAIVVLGFLTVRNLILTSTLYNIFIGDASDSREFDRKKFWRHSVATAICARLLVSRTAPGQKEEEEAFTLGILHDIGKVFFDIYYHNEFMKALREHKKNDTVPMIEIEKKIIGIDHAEVGGIMIDKWNLPEYFIEPIKYHHTPSKARNKFITSILHVADIIGKFTSINYQDDFKKAHIDGDAISALKLNENDVKILVQNLEFEMSNADLFLNS